MVDETKQMEEGEGEEELLTSEWPVPPKQMEKGEEEGEKGEDELLTTVLPVPPKQFWECRKDTKRPGCTN